MSVRRLISYFGFNPIAGGADWQTEITQREERSMADKTFDFDDEDEPPVKKPAPKPVARKPDSDAGRPAPKPAARPAPPPARRDDDDDEDEEEEEERPRKTKIMRRRGTKRFQLVCELDLKAMIVPTILWSLLIGVTFGLAMPFFWYYLAKMIINNVSVEEFD
jgi:hypothetical protein